MVSRRSLIVAGGAGLGLIVAWAAWPRHYAGNLTAAPGEIVFGAWLKIGEDGQVTVAVPQAEHGQGVWTALPQIVADELGADWRTVGVEAAPLNPLYANPLAAGALFAGMLDRLPAAVERRNAIRSDIMLTGCSTSVRMFEPALREAGAAARVLLCKAAAARWAIEWEECETANGFVTAGKRRLRFAELAGEAANLDVPAELPTRIGDEGRLAGRSVARLDSPGKLDGSANFAGDIRLPDMVFASVMAGPLGDSRLVHVDKAAADRVRGVISVVENERWVAAIANNWWAADRALEALAPRFETRGGVIDNPTIGAALDKALSNTGQRIASIGDIYVVLNGQGVVTADYSVSPSLSAAIEPPTATAWWHGDRLELWLGTQAPESAREAAAQAIGIAPAAVILHPTLIGGSFGAALESAIATQAATLAAVVKRPVQLTWSRREAQMRLPMRAPARARMTARLGARGAITGWRAQIAAPATGQELTARLLPGNIAARIARHLPDHSADYAVAGAVPPYRLPALAIDHHIADVGVPTGHVRGMAHGYTAFFTECFIDELARHAGVEPMAYRMRLLGDDARLARCLSTVAALGGWNGGEDGSGQGIACHAMAGSHIAVFAELTAESGRIQVDRLVAAVDCGRQINPDLVRQQIEGGLIFGLAAAFGATTRIERNLVTATGLGALALPRLADTPDITVEVIASVADPGGVGDLGMVAVAPALANALRSATGNQLRRLPLNGNA